MLSNIILLILSAGIPYYLVFEKMSKFKSKYIFIFSALLLLSAISISLFMPHYISDERAMLLVSISLVSALISVYKATKTTNFYKLGYYLIFVNAPFFFLLKDQASLYSLALLVSLSGLFFVGRYYEKHYGSANYHHITGVTLITPCIGTYLTIYLIALALYPPLPNSIYFLSYLFQSEPNTLWYIAVTLLFFSNFFLAMRVMRTTLFGRANPKIHYVHMNYREKFFHSLIVVLLLALSIYGLKETLL